MILQLRIWNELNAAKRIVISNVSFGSVLDQHHLAAKAKTMILNNVPILQLIPHDRQKIDAALTQHALLGLIIKL